MPWRRTMSRARNSAARPEVSRRSTTGRVRRNRVSATRVSPMASSAGARKRSARCGEGHVWIPTSRSDTAHMAVHHGMCDVVVVPRWVKSSMEPVVSTVMPTDARPRAPRGPSGATSQSEAAWKSRRLTTRSTSTARATSDSSTSAPATRWRTMVPESRATATRQARRWPRRMPRPRATRASPAMAISAPAATLARSGRNSSTTCSRPRSGGVMASSRSMIAGEAGWRPTPTAAPGGSGGGPGGGRGPAATTRPSGRRPPARDGGSPALRPRVTSRSSTLGEAQLVAGQQHPDVELGPGLELDPADPLVVEEDRGQAEPPPVLLHHLGGGPHVGVEADPEVGELRLEGGRGDQAGVAPADQPPAGVPGGVVGPGLGLHRRRARRHRGSTTSGG